MGKENSIHGDDARLGYSQEEDYFHRINQILVARLKSKVNCPVCQGHSTPAVRDGAVINRCTQCQNEFEDPNGSDASSLPF